MVLGDQVVSSDSLGACISYLRPVITEALSNNWYKLVAESNEFIAVFDGSSIFIEDIGTGQKDGVDDEVTDFPDESVDVVNSLEDAFQDSVELKVVQVSADGFNNILHDPHARFKRLPSLSIVHCLVARLLKGIDLLLVQDVGVCASIYTTLWFSGKCFFNILQQGLEQR